jgi:hypothetical protein
MHSLQNCAFFGITEVLTQQAMNSATVRDMHLRNFRGNDPRSQAQRARRSGTPVFGELAECKAICRCYSICLFNDAGRISSTIQRCVTGWKRTDGQGRGFGVIRHSTVSALWGRGRPVSEPRSEPMNSTPQCNGALHLAEPIGNDYTA